MSERADEVCEPCTDRVGHTRPQCDGLCDEAMEALLRECDFPLTIPIVDELGARAVLIPIFVVEKTDRFPTLWPTFQTDGKTYALEAEYPDRFPREAITIVELTLKDAAKALDGMRIEGVKGLIGL